MAAPCAPGSLSRPLLHRAAAEFSYSLQMCRPGTRHSELDDSQTPQEIRDQELSGHRLCCYDFSPDRELLLMTPATGMLRREFPINVAWFNFLI